MKARVGLFGGTFDPIHLGHLQLAVMARELYGLDEIRFIPAAAPPHKDSAAVAGFDHRVEMVRLALSQREGLTLSTVEGRLPKPSYTIDTLRFFLSDSPGTDFFFLVGSDSFVTISSWKSWRSLLQLANFIVFIRDDRHLYQARELLQKLEYTQENRQDGWLHPQGDVRILLPEIGAGAILDISSTRIRQKIAQDQAVELYLHPDVRRYIREHALYGAL